MRKLYPCKHCGAKPNERHAISCLIVVNTVDHTKKN